MRVKRRERRASTKGTEQFFDELKLQFDLMRLRRLRAALREEDARLTQKEELLKANLLNAAGALATYPLDQGTAVLDRSQAASARGSPEVVSLPRGGPRVRVATPQHPPF